MKILFSVLTITLLGLIACGGKGDVWAIPEEYQNLSLDQLKDQSTITTTKPLTISQESAAYNTQIDDTEEFKAAEDKLDQLGYFEGEVDMLIQRSDDPTTYDVWFCVGKRNEKALKAGDSNTCKDLVFIAYKSDRGPLIETVAKINTARNYSLENTVKMRFSGIFEGIQKRRTYHSSYDYDGIFFYPKFRLIKAEFIE